MKLPSLLLPLLPHRSAAARCSHRRRSLCAAADPAPATPVDHNTHPQVELGELSPLGAIPAAGEPPPRRETTAAASSVPNSGEGPLRD